MSRGDNRHSTVLVAEDDSAVLSIIEEILQDAGFTVVCAENGSKAFDLINADRGRFDVLLTDNRMPGVGGIELLQRLSTLPFSGRIVVYSGSLTHTEIEEFQSLGAASILHKPASAVSLVRAVRGSGSPTNAVN